MTCPRPRPELLAPAGDWEALRAAVANGADAVYFGLSNFNARHRAANFTPEELPTVMQYLHDRNVRGYVAFNTLIFSDELPEAVAMIRVIAEAGADAVIVQDFGLVELIRRVAPGLSIHASTQTTPTEARGIEFVKSLGVQRVILARELSVGEIAKIAGATDMPLEVFVHGALCVAYSGQCLTSEALGGRSANRGQCAQACRLPYQLIVDGVPRELGDKAYLLSPQDLAAPELIADLVRLGVSCFKIEGRLKSAHYVAATTQSYRAALSAALEGRPFEPTRQQQIDLEQSFSRGLTHGFLDGVNHQLLVHGRFPKSRGVKVGTVVGKTARGLIVEGDADDPAKLVKPGDGIVFDEGHPEQDEQGGRVYEVTPLGRAGTGRAELVFGRGDVQLAAVPLGSLVWKTDDPALRRRLEQSFVHDRPARRVRVHVAVEARSGKPLVAEFRDDAGHAARVESEQPLEPARKHPLTVELLRDQFGRLGETPFELGGITAEPLEPVMAPKSVLNDLRRRATEQLIAARTAATRTAVVEPGALETMRAAIAGKRSTPTPSGLEGEGQGRGVPSSWASAADAPAGTQARLAVSRLYVLARSPEQLAAVLDWAPPAGTYRPAMVYCDFEDVRRYKDAVAAARAAEIPIGLGAIRVLKAHEDGLLAHILGCEPDAVLVRNLGTLAYCREHAPTMPLVGDFSLNIANELTADLFRRRNLVRMVPGYDLNWEQLTAMLGRIDPGLFETVIHQHMPMFHMEHCVYAAFMSNGKDWRDCGRPCDVHKVELLDRAGAAHPLSADVGCRNTLYNAVAQSAAEFVPRMRSLGLRHFRVELVRETTREVAPLLDRYAKVIAGIEDGSTVWRQLRLINQLGVTRGTLSV